MTMTHDAFGIPLASGFPEADSAMMIEIDFLMTEGLGIRLPLMKENAGRSFARLVLRRYFPGGLAGRRITVLAGKGGNGDIALLAARRLADWGAAITIVAGADRVFAAGRSDGAGGRADRLGECERRARSVTGPAVGL
jgi:YjeF-related protein N-terminus